METREQIFFSKEDQEKMSEIVTAATDVIIERSTTLTSGKGIQTAALVAAIIGMKASEILTATAQEVGISGIEKLVTH